jgi:hypothetical protein
LGIVALHSLQTCGEGTTPELSVICTSFGRKRIKKADISSSFTIASFPASTASAQKLCGQGILEILEEQAALEGRRREEKVWDEIVTESKRDFALKSEVT